MSLNILLSHSRSLKMESLSSVSHLHSIAPMAVSIQNGDAFCHHFNTDFMYLCKYTNVADRGIDTAQRNRLRFCMHLATKVRSWLFRLPPSTINHSTNTSHNRDLKRNTSTPSLIRTLNLKRYIDTNTQCNA